MCVADCMGSIRMKFIKSYTPKDWDFGIGFFRGNVITIKLPMFYKLLNYPPSIALYLGPYTFELEFKTKYVDYRISIDNQK